MPDTIEKLGSSLIQHGKDSDRIYLMKLHPDDASSIVARIEELADAHDYGKIFCKVPAPFVGPFEKAGYSEEARVPGFFGGEVDAAFMSRFRKPQRAELDDIELAAVKEPLSLAEKKQHDAPSGPPEEYTIRRLEASDVDQLAALYRVVFPSYPFPIFDPDYLRRTMADHIRYYGAFHTDGLVAASSAETDPDARNSEMTDFATVPAHRGKRLAVHLLLAMEPDLRASGFATAYTIARAASVGMNVTFARCGYRFAGTLINNTQISGQIESMNVWYKGLRAREA